MSSWRNDVSAQAQRDLDALIDAAIGVAMQLLTDHGEFFPFAIEIDKDGKTAMVAARPDKTNDKPLSADVIESCFAALADSRDNVRAAAVVADVRLPDLGSDAIQVDLEHAEGLALTTLLPYRKRGSPTRVECGELSASVGTQRIW